VIFIAYPPLTRPKESAASIGEEDGMSKITKRLVESIKPTADRDVLVWDQELRGFGVRVKRLGSRVKPSISRSYVLQYRNESGRSRRYTIGQHGRLTAEAARSEAKRLLGMVERGADPAEDRKVARRGGAVADLCGDYLKDHAETRKKPRSIEQDRRMIERFIRPALAHRKIVDVSRADVVRLHSSLRDTPFQANRVLALLSKMMNLAERWGLRPDGSNPCRHVERFKERKRERFLSAGELAALGEALTAIEQERTELPGTVAAIRLLILTGCRLSEVLTLHWQDVDFEAVCLRLPDSKTGAKIVHLNAPALEVLAGIERRDGNPHVIVGGKPGAHLVNLEKPWRRIRQRATVSLWRRDEKAAGLVTRLYEKLGREPTYQECLDAADFDLPASLAEVRLHDLRHSFASIAAGLGEGLPMIGKLLGHTQAQTTARYAHLSADPVKVATARIGAALAGMMAGNRAQVVDLTARRK
jgi:integrase